MNKFKLFAALLFFQNSISDLAAAQNKKTDIDKLFASFTPTTPGCALAVSSHKGILFQQGYGLASIEHNVQIDAVNTSFEIASASKQFTAVSIYLLVTQGKLNKNDDVRKYIPELPRYEKTITIDNLIHHTSGLRDYTELMSLSGYSFEDWTNEEDALSIIVKQKGLNFEPASKFSYSNTNYFLMSVIVQRVTGTSLAEYAKQNIFLPLGMNKTFYLTDHTTVIRNRAFSYEEHGIGEYALRMSDWEQIGDGGVQSTASDLAKWQQNLQNPIPSLRHAVDNLRESGRLANDIPIGYGGGVFLSEYKGHHTIGHGGVMLGFRSSLISIPDQSVSIVVLCNVSSAAAEDLARKVANLYISHTAYERSVPIKPLIPVSNLDAWTGTYWSESEAQLRKLEIADGKFWYVIEGSLRRELVANGAEKFEMLDAPQKTELVLDMDLSNGRSFYITTTAGSSKYLQVNHQKPSATGLMDYVGNFTSPELNGTIWSIFAKDEMLFIKAPREDPVRLTPVFEKAFSVGNLMIVFDHDGDGSSPSFTLYTARAIGVKFHKIQ